ncbi:MAG: hypothetical protein NTV49_07845 [Kiritimatiellaeota bacterium]|nr:hypothetical protein [Kiritimatiellota bacterium]
MKVKRWITWAVASALLLSNAPVAMALTNYEPGKEAFDRGYQKQKAQNEEIARQIDEKYDAKTNEGLNNIIIAVVVVAVCAAAFYAWNRMSKKSTPMRDQSRESLRSNPPAVIVALHPQGQGSEKGFVFSANLLEVRF